MQWIPEFAMQVISKRQCVRRISLDRVGRYKNGNEKASFKGLEHKLNAMIFHTL